MEVSNLSECKMTGVYIARQYMQSLWSVLSWRLVGNSGTGANICLVPHRVLLTNLYNTVTKYSISKKNFVPDREHLTFQESVW